MAYDYPYRLEDHVKVTLTGKELCNYAIVRTGIGVICEGSDHMEMRKIVDTLNEQAQEDGR